MGLVVGGKQQWRQVRFLAVDLGGQFQQLSLERGFQKQLVFQPDRHRRQKGFETGGYESQVGFQQAFKLDQRFFIKDHIVKFANTDPGLFEAIGDSVSRKCSIVFLA